MNGHAAADKDEPTCGMHHSLREQMGQLVDRERVLCSENDQLRAQLVEMKEQENKKYDDLMVQYYNIKREYEHDGLDKQGTSNNQVTLKTEWDHEEVKVQIKEEDEDDRCVVKKEEVEDGEETRIIDMETLTQDRQVKREIEQEENEMTLHNDQIGHWVKREIKEEEEDAEMVEVKEEIKEEEEEEEEEDGEMVEVKEEEEEDGEAEIDLIEGWAENNQSGEDESQALDNAPLNTTLTHPTRQSQLTVTQSADLLSSQTSTAQDETSPTALNQQATASTGRNGNKRRQPTSKRSAKRSKITIEEDEGEDGDDGEDIVNDREDAKIKILHLNCTQSNCNVKLDSMLHLKDHLSTVHRLLPLQCYATNCNARFDKGQQISAHNRLNHSRNTRFLCPVCHKEYDSQHNAYDHWYQNHLTGQFQCNLVSDCAQVTDTRFKMRTHQKTKHEYQSKHLHCTHPGCTVSFSCNADLKRHQLTHLATNQFHCNWPHCSKQCKLRSNLVQHIRTQHFGLPKSKKAQKEKNIVHLRDPNEYVRVVVDE